MSAHADFPRFFFLSLGCVNDSHMIKGMLKKKGRSKDDGMSLGA